ncbi:MAG: imidazole glycerol phosphate synthase cyclase subunit [Thermodesulfovibrionales bacterium]|nr:imidazole glycerol phosphate synthase cyclase subunit [Thermodesulfovibrionales bacterium]
MKSVRIIARLDIKGPNVVKGIHLEGLRVLGRPELFAPKYYEDGADELLYMDTVASLYGRNNLADIVSRAAENLYIPLTVGGGIRSVEDIRSLLRAGADKVAINTAAINNPNLVTEGARAFGSQCIVVSIEAKHRGPGKYECLTDNGREKTGVDVFEWVKRAADLGAGEILITSIDREGTGKGYDVELTRTVSDMVDIPVIACGGAGDADHVREVIQEGHADAVCAASIFHYGMLDYMVTRGEYKEEGNISFLRSGGHTRKLIKPVSIPYLKKYLSGFGIGIRMLRENKG